MDWVKDSWNEFLKKPNVETIKSFLGAASRCGKIVTFYINDEVYATFSAEFNAFTYVNKYALKFDNLDFDAGNPALSLVKVQKYFNDIWTPSDEKHTIEIQYTDTIDWEL